MDFAAWQCQTDRWLWFGPEISTAGRFSQEKLLKSTAPYCSALHNRQFKQDATVAYKHTWNKKNEE